MIDFTKYFGIADHNNSVYLTESMFIKYDPNLDPKISNELINLILDIHREFKDMPISNWITVQIYQAFLDLKNFKTVWNEKIWKKSLMKN
jgi:hypothetical protein